MNSSLKMSAKTMVDSFVCTDAYTNRYEEHPVCIDGRTWIKTGTRTATALVGNLYEVPSDVEPQYVLLVGAARQSEKASSFNSEQAEEIAAFNANIDPIVTIKLSKRIHSEEFCALAKLYINEMQEPKMLLTDCEKNILLL